MSRIIPVILAGGSGTRLWPVSRAARPKPFQSLVGAGSLIQQTALRVGNANLFAPPIIVGNEGHAGLIEDQLAECGVAAATLILEPIGRNTALAIALAAFEAGAGDAVLLVLPSDHVVTDKKAFLTAIRAGVPAALDGALVTFGVRPDRPETGYGYIERGEETKPGVHAVTGFVEKPNRTTAEGFVADGAHDWNAGIFLFRADHLLAELGAHAPDILHSARAAFDGATREGARLHPESEAFASARSQSIDHAVMEPSKRVVVVPVAMGWSDVGDWDALYEFGKKDRAGNALTGDVVVTDSRDCLIRSDGPLVVASGVHDLIVVATRDAVLILSRGEGQRVGEIVARLGSRNLRD